MSSADPYTHADERYPGNPELDPPTTRLPRTVTPNHSTRNESLLHAGRQTSPSFASHAPAAQPSIVAPFVATHLPSVGNQPTVFNSSRSVEPWRVGERSLTLERRFFVVMHRTTPVLPQPMGVVQIERPFLQVIDSKDIFLWCISGQ